MSSIMPVFKIMQLLRIKQTTYFSTQWISHHCERLFSISYWTAFSFKLHKCPNIWIDWWGKNQHLSLWKTSCRIPCLYFLLYFIKFMISLSCSVFSMPVTWSRTNYGCVSSTIHRIVAYELHTWMRCCHHV